MFHRRPHPPYAFIDRMYAHPPATVIRLLTGLARKPPASPHYRHAMTTVDAALFSRPDYGELVALATAVKTEHARSQQ